MAYFTEVVYGRTLTEAEQTSVDNYLSEQVTAGTTDGNLYLWGISGKDAATSSVRMWSTQESGSGYISLVNSFSPPASSAKIY
jgi:hypothetical protein